MLRGTTEGGLLHFHLKHGMHEGLERGLGLLLGDAGLQPAEGVHPSSAALLEHVFGIADDDLGLHHDRYEEFGRASELDAVETRLCNANDGHLVIVQQQILADDTGVAGKTSPPEVVTEDYVRMAAGNAIFIGGEEATEKGPDSENREVRTRHHFELNEFRLAVRGEARGVGKTAKHFGKDFVVIAKIAKHGMGDGIAAPVAAVVVAAHGEKDELLGIFDGKEAQEDLIEEGENGGVCADAERQGEDGYGGKAGSADEHAEGIFQVAKGGVEPADDGHAASGLIGGLGHRDNLRITRGKDEGIYQKFDESTKRFV